MDGPGPWNLQIRVRKAGGAEAISRLVPKAVEPMRKPAEVICQRQIFASRSDGDG